jgi:hypothetical protein
MAERGGPTTQSGILYHVMVRVVIFSPAPDESLTVRCIDQIHQQYNKFYYSIFRRLKKELIKS